VSALRFFFTVTIDRPDLSRRLVLVRHERAAKSERRGRGAPYSLSDGIRDGSQIQDVEV
jgi:hypothetical protein